MSRFRNRLIALCLAALVLIAAGGFVVIRGVTGSDSVGDERSTPPDAPSAMTSPSTTVTTSTSVPLGSGQPVPSQTPVPKIEPKVETEVSVSRATQVLVAFELQPTGNDDEKRAQVQRGIDEITDELPFGSWSVVGPTLTIPVVNLVVDRDAVDVLRTLPQVLRVNWAFDEFALAETDDVREPAGEMAPSASTTTMGAPTAWAAGFKGAGTTIAVVDAGVQTDHPFLSNGTVQKTVGEACFAVTRSGYTSSCPGGSPMSVSEASKVGAGAPCPVDITGEFGEMPCHHGTHVAGIAVGGTGATGSGIAPDASLISIQIYSYSYAANRITATESGVVDALVWLYNRRADFPGLTAVNLSLGGEQKFPGYCDTEELPTFSAVQQLLNVGIVTVVAAGNDSWTDGVSSPGCLSNVVTVSAQSFVNEGRASYANFGPQVDLFAPGTITSSIPCNRSTTLQGTSMATPAVAGSFAILRQTSPATTLSRLQATGGVVSGYPTGPPSVKLDQAIVGLPGRPGSVSGVASGGQVSVSWSAASGGSGSISAYTVTAKPGGQSCSTAGLSCTVSGLDTTKSYAFVVRATGTSGVGPGTASALIPLADVPPAPTDYVPLTPARLMDTRSVVAGALTIDGNDEACGAIGQGATRKLMVVGRAGVPSSGVDAVAVNVTVVSPTASNFLRVYPSGATPPNASNINFLAGQTIPNMAIVKVGTDGMIAVYNEQGSTQVIVDVVGWFPDGSDYTGVVPQRLLDTRSPAQGGGGTVDGGYSGIGALGPGQSLVLPVVGRGTIPSLASVGAVALNVTAVTPTASNFVTVYPSGSALPTASNLNFTAGQTIANMVISKVGPDGAIVLFNNAGVTQFVVDIVGYFPPATPPTTEYNAMVPQRLLDTRTSAQGGAGTVDGAYSGIGPIGPGQSLTLPVTGRGTSPVIPAGAGAVVLNVTVVGSTASNFLTVNPFGSALPTTSNLNFVAGQIIPNMVIVKLGSGGRISVFNNAGSTPVIVDVVGWFPG